MGVPAALAFAVGDVHHWYVYVIESPGLSPVQLPLFASSTKPTCGPVIALPSATTAGIKVCNPVAFGFSFDIMNEIVGAPLLTGAADATALIASMPIRQVANSRLVATKLRAPPPLPCMWLLNIASSRS